MEVLFVSRTFVASASSSEKLISPFVNPSTCQAIITRSSSSFLGFPCLPKRFSSLQRREGRGGMRAPSALLNAHEYRKQKLEKVLLKEMGSDIENGDNDEDLCPIECVREINKLSELDHAIEDSRTSGALVVVDFFRTSCGSCRYIGKGVQKLCKGAGNGEASVIFLKHNVMDEYDEQSDIAEKFRVKVVPLFHFYKNGELVESFPTRDKAKILEAIYKHLDVNQTIEEWTDLHGLKNKIRRLQKKEQEKDPESKEWNLLVYRRERKLGRMWLVFEVFREIFVPILFLVVGVFCSAISLTIL